MSVEIKPRLRECLKQLRLPTMADNAQSFASLATNEGWPYDRLLLELCELELSERQQRKVGRLLAESCLPREKTAVMFDKTRLEPGLAQKWDVLKTGDFLKRNENVLAFGNPGSGKTHMLCAVGHELVRQGHAVLFKSCALLVQRLLLAKSLLRLDKELKRLDKYDALIIDDIGYVQQSRQEMEVLFTLLSHRYEQRSVMITSNLVFSQWERIFKDPMTTAAAVDRLVHHSVILELNMPSFRMEQAKAALEPEST
jgi:DNA replication protein DnaC